MAAVCLCWSESETNTQDEKFDFTHDQYLEWSRGGTLYFCFSSEQLTKHDFKNAFASCLATIGKYLGLAHGANPMSQGIGLK